jgi:hypothetical protein
MNTNKSTKNTRQKRARSSKPGGPVRFIQRPGGIASRRDDPTGYVPTPGSPSLEVLRRERRRRRAA